RLRDGDERLRRPAAPGPFLLRRGGLASRRRYPRRFTTLLPEMWRPRRIAESGRFVCGGQLEQFIERSRSSIDTRRRVASLRETRRRGNQRERRWIAAGDLIPFERHRDTRVGCRPDGPGRRYRTVLGVLIVVEEHAVAFFLPPLACRLIGRAPFHLARKGQRSAAHLSEAPAPFDANVDMHAARSGGFRPAAKAVLVEHVAQN